MIKAMAAATALFCISAQSLMSQEKIAGIAEFDRTVHDFGDVMVSDGPLSCTFNVKNISSKPMLIHSIVTSCGCTDVKWTRKPILPGESGSISAVYTNDEGPYPFDKSLTVYISGIGKPVMLKLRGISHDKKLSIEEMYPERLGTLGFKTKELKCGNIEQGGTKSETATIANLSGTPAAISFVQVSDNLNLQVEPNPIPARSTAELQFTVSASEDLWGKNVYTAVPVINGKASSGPIAIKAFTRANFSSLSHEERENASKPMFESSTFSFGKAKRGTVIESEFKVKNIGKADLKIYKADCEAGAFYAYPFPVVQCGYEDTIRFRIGTDGMPVGETLVLITLTTNSPSRPIINLFVAGWIE